MSRHWAGMSSVVLPREPFTRASLPALGVTSTQLRDLLATQEIRRVLRGVYLAGAVPDSIEVRAQAAKLVVSESAVLCDRTAAWLYGIDVLKHRELEILPPLELFVLRDRHRVERSGCRGGERDLAPSDIQVVHGVAVTTPLRTAMDLGCRLWRYDALAALDAFMAEHSITTDMVYQHLPRYRRRRGVVQLRQLVPLADARAESPRESWVRLAIHDANLPPPTLQHWIREHGEDIFRLDHAYPLSRVAVEYDGQLHHHSTHAQMRADRRRREWLRERGWTVIVVTREAFLRDREDRSWIYELRQALRLS